MGPGTVAGRGGWAVALATIVLVVLWPAAAHAGEGLPDGVADAARRPAPTLPAPAGWPFPEAFPQTSGTGRLAGGAFEWSDFVYDDHGAVGVPGGSQMASLSRWKGAYEYTVDDAHRNGADIFRLGVGLEGGMSYWRVDWVTLADPDVPIAAFGIGDGAEADGPALPWPAGAGVRSRGLAKVLLLSSRGAWLVDPVTGLKTSVGDLGGDLSVDRAAKSFIVRLPRAALGGPARTRVWAVAGVANDAGDGFRPVGLAEKALPGQPAVYNAAFRSIAQEPPYDNAWMEATQASVLADGDVTRFSQELDWDRLAAAETTPEPLPTGYSNRWYVSSIAPGEGIKVTSSHDGLPNILGPVLPYSVYVPTTYDPSRPAPLTWTLHSLGLLHNEYGHLTPRFLQSACEDRGSICAGPSGRSPDIEWFDEAELDFWEIWRDLARTYRLDSERTVISGYSMGGLGSTKLSLGYPSVFAKAVPIAGGLDCGIFITYGLGASGAGKSCKENGHWPDILPSARWVPYLIGSNSADEASPIINAAQRVSELDALGYRNRLEVWSADDHFTPLIRDGFASIAKAMGLHERKRDPGRITFTWYTNIVRSDWGLGPTDVYWLSGLRHRTTAPGMTASIDATSEGRPDQPVTLRRLPPSVAHEPNETPKAITESVWDPSGPVPAPRNRVVLDTKNVRTLAIDGVAAGLVGDRELTIEVKSDGVNTVRLDLAIAASMRMVSDPVGCATGFRRTQEGAAFDVGAGTCTARLTQGAGPTDPGGPGGPGSPSSDGGQTGGQGSGTAGQGSGSGPGAGGTRGANACLASRTIARATAKRSGRGLRIGFRRTTSQPVTVDVFQQSIGRRVVGERLVARFADRTRGFRWNGRANRGGQRVRDGYFMVRYRMRGSSGVLDTRRLVLQRRNGRFVRRPGHFGREGCKLIEKFKLQRPVFGGTGRRSLAIAYRLTSSARVRVTVRRGKQVVKRYRTARRAGTRTYRLRLRSRGLRRGNYRVTVRAIRGGTSQTRRLTSRRL